MPAQLGLPTIDILFFQKENMDEDTGRNNAKSIYPTLFRSIENEEKVALVSVASIRSSAPHETDTMMIVKEDGDTIGSVGGGDIELYVIKKAQEIIQRGEPERVLVGVSTEEEKKRGMELGGKLKFFIEPIKTIPTIYIFGAGALAIPLSKIGKLMGFKIIVIDNDPHFANARRLPDADLILANGFDNLLSKLDLNSSSNVVIATRGHQYDETALHQILKGNSKYIGLIQSQKKIKALFDRLRSKDIPNSLLKSVHVPIGLDINASTLDEIALSIITEIVSVRRKGMRLL
jgi:xanthine dehydrogenase accessory factor